MENSRRQAVRGFPCELCGLRKLCVPKVGFLVKNCPAEIGSVLAVQFHKVCRTYERASRRGFELYSEVCGTLDHRGIERHRVSKRDPLKICLAREMRYAKIDFALESRRRYAPIGYIVEIRKPFEFR